MYAVTKIYRSHYSRKHISDCSEYRGIPEDVLTFSTKIQTSMMHLRLQIITTNTFINRAGFSVEKQLGIVVRKGLSICGDKCACQHINVTCLAFPGRAPFLHYGTENTEKGK